MKLAKINIDDIVLGNNIRFVNDDELRDLAKNIEQYGLINPLTVKKTERGYELIAGRRRYLALKMLGEYIVPVNIMEMEKKEKEIVKLAENIQRKNLEPVEVIEALDKMRDMGMTLPMISRAINKPLSWIENKYKYKRIYNRLLESGISAGELQKIPEGHIIKMVGLKKEEQEQLVKWYLEVTKAGGRVTQRDIVRERKKMKGERVKLRDDEVIEGDFAITVVGTRSILLTFRDDKKMYEVLRGLKKLGGAVYYSKEVS